MDFTIAVDVAVPDAVAGLWNVAVTPADAATRLFAALLGGFLIGLDREWRDKPAGLRTHMLVSLAAALFTLVAFDIHGDVAGAEPGNAVSDPLRLIEAITAGVAFLAAGNIIRRGSGVEGLTTGAGLWLAGAVGLSCGRGHFGIAALAVLLAVIVLSLLRIVTRGVERIRDEDDSPS
ncbi:MAG TPA: MgtC/SapB family protein [Paracoccaceae bacterium]|nr:MgtC/SapB family protein [Paracoccaceae bacterium]